MWTHDQLALSLLFDRFVFSEDSNDKNFVPTATSKCLSASMLQTWSTLPTEVRSALVALEASKSGSDLVGTQSSGSLTSFFSPNSDSSRSGDNKSDNESDLTFEEVSAAGTKTVLKPRTRSQECV